MSADLIETFPALVDIPGLRHGFTLRHPGIDVKTDRATALERLDAHFHDCLDALAIPHHRVATGEQVHGNHIAVCSGEGFPGSPIFPETDGLITNVPGQYLGVYVADCGAVFLIDPVNRACGLVHSGKKGTELGIAPRAIAAMEENFGSAAGDLVVQLAPCIRPPAYEIDFAARIVADCRESGVPANQVYDCDTCTSTDLERYYSYRIEQGETGRLFAVVGFADAELEAS